MLGCPAMEKGSTSSKLAASDLEAQGKHQKRRKTRKEHRKKAEVGQKKTGKSLKRPITNSRHFFLAWLRCAGIARLL